MDMRNRHCFFVNCYERTNVTFQNQRHRRSTIHKICHYTGVSYSQRVCFRIHQNCGRNCKCSEKRGRKHRSCRYCNNRHTCRHAASGFPLTSLLGIKIGLSLAQFASELLDNNSIDHILSKANSLINFMIASVGLSASVFAICAASFISQSVSL